MAAQSNGGGIPVWDSGTSTPQYLGGDQLSSGQTLGPNQYIESPSGQYVLYMAPDGTATVFNNTSSSACPAFTLPYARSWSQYYYNENQYFKLLPEPQQPVAQATLSMQQSDGNLVLYTPSGVAEWASNTAGNPGAYLRMQNDGNLVVYGASGQALWADVGDQIVGSVLCPGDEMTTSQSMKAVGYEAGVEGTTFIPGWIQVFFAPVGKSGGWEFDIGSGHAGPTGATSFWKDNSAPAQVYLVQQGDGNLVIYPSGTSASGTALWATATDGFPGAITYLSPSNAVDQGILSVETLQNSAGTLFVRWLWEGGVSVIPIKNPQATPPQAIPWGDTAP